MSSSERAVKVERLMTTAIDADTHTHVISKPDLNKRNRTGLKTHLLDKQTDFSGEARVAQVLRWVSTATLQANASQKSQTARTPEAQASVVGSRLLLGTNATDDSSIPDALKTLVTDKGSFDKRITALRTARSKITGTDTDSKEKLRINKQEERHLTHLRAFATDDNYFNKFVEHSIGELRAQRDKEPDFNASDLNDLHQAKKVAAVFKHYEDSESQMRSMFSTIRASLRAGNASSGPRIEMAPGLPGQHAEQRIIEKVQQGHDSEETETRKVRGKTLLPEIQSPQEKRVQHGALSSTTQSETTAPRRNDHHNNPNRTVDGWTGAAIYKIPQQSFNPDHPKRLAAKKRMEEYLNPSPSPSGRVDFIASEKTLVHTPQSLTPQTLTMPLAGTKPPCDMCETTEQARHNTAQKSGAKISSFRITRFEDLSNRVGLLFPGQYQNSGDKRVQKETTTLLANTSRTPRADVNTRKRADSVTNFPKLP